MVRIRLEVVALHYCPELSSVLPSFHVQRPPFFSEQGEHFECIDLSSHPLDRGSVPPGPIDLEAQTGRKAAALQVDGESKSS